jgi:antitoxin (DNA-binding transcriptional repressor) of toxin-antitoxin stability system
MTILELEAHPELRDLVERVRRGEAIEIADHGQSVARVARVAVVNEDMAAFRASLGVPVMPNAVIEMREADER